MSSGFERLDADMLSLLSRFKSKGWLSDVPATEQDLLKKAIARNLILDGPPYKLTRYGIRIVQARYLR